MTRSRWTPPLAGWPTFGPDGYRNDRDEETATERAERHNCRPIGCSGITTEAAHCCNAHAAHRDFVCLDCGRFLRAVGVGWIPAGSTNPTENVRRAEQ